MLVAYVRAFVVVLAFSTASLQGKTFSGHAAFEHPPTLSFSEVERWLEADSKANPKPVRSVEDLLERLPESYRRYNTLIFHSRSLQRAHQDYPRVLFFGADARLITAISTHPDDPRKDVVEFMEFDPKTAKFHAHEIDFGAKLVKATTPDNCVNCHRADLRPNWDPYDVWPGVYGTLHDTLPGGSNEANWYKDLRLRVGAANEVILGRLKYVPDFGIAVWPEEDPQRPRTRYTLSHGVASNGVLSLVIAFANRERIVRQILDSKDHDKYRFAIGAALADCSQPLLDFLPESMRANHPKDFAELLAKTRSSIISEHRDRVGSAATLAETSHASIATQIDAFGLRSEEIKRTTQLRYLLEKRTNEPLDVEGWSNTLNYGTYTFNDGVGGLSNLVGHYAPRAFADLPKIAKGFPYKKVEYHATFFGENDPFRLEVYQREGNNEQVCVDLLAASRALK